MVHNHVGWVSRTVGWVSRTGFLDRFCQFTISHKFLIYIYSTFTTYYEAMSCNFSYRFFVTSCVFCIVDICVKEKHSYSLTLTLLLFHAFNIHVFDFHAFNLHAFNFYVLDLHSLIFQFWFPHSLFSCTWILRLWFPRLFSNFDPRFEINLTVLVNYDPCNWILRRYL